MDLRLTVWRYSCIFFFFSLYGEMHVDVRMRQKAGTQTENKIREILCNGPSAKIYTLEICTVE